MSDRDKLESLLTGFGVGYNGDVARFIDQHAINRGAVVMAVGDGMIDGHGGFECRFNFDKDGNFVGIDILE